MYRPGDLVKVEFVTSSFTTGAATNADSTPTGTVNQNGTDDGAVTVTVTNIDTGRYKATFTIPTTYAALDELNLTISATVSSTVGKAVVWHGRLFNNNFDDINLVRKGTAQAGTVATIKLDSSASSTNNIYNNCLIWITSGTGANQARTITAYNGTSKQANVDHNWTTAPDSTSVFRILAADNPSLNANLQVSANVARVTIRSNTAQAGSTSNTIKLDSGASATSNLYANDLITTTGGTGLGQTRTIIAYNGSTKVATVDKAWVTVPDNTTTFDIYASTTPSQFSDQGVAQAGAASTLTLASTASSVTDIYVGSILTILSGTDAGDTSEITAYNGSTKVATVSPAWAVTPGSTSAYAVIPTSASQTAVSSPTATEIATTILSADSTLYSGTQVGALINQTYSTAQTYLNYPLDSLAQEVSDLTDFFTSPDQIYGTVMPEDYAAPGQGLTLATFAYGTNQLLEEKSISGTTITVKKRDQSTTAMTFTMNSATVPTSSTQAS